ncbi:MAG: HAD-IA family hydrolase [Ferruginibacter sp.]|nr:HAD-IA family hydrolase [Ferruginibacter sp.]
MQAQKITTLFLDIGGVLLTNGWGRSSRALAAQKFKLDIVEINERHHLCFDTYEMGKLSMDEYLKQVIFYENRDFSSDEFKTFIYAQSQPLGDHIAFFKALKATHGLKVFAVNNEAKEMNEYRIRQFELYSLFDAFVSSCYVGLRKPDKDIFHLACDLAQVSPEQAIMIDDRQMFVDVAAGIGLNAMQFDTLENAKEKINSFFPV